MSTQQQDLALFTNGAIVPQARICGLITHTQGTAPAWLIDVLIENGVFNTCHINHDKPSRRTAQHHVMVISFIHDSKFHNLKKLTIDLDDVPQFHFIDLFTDLFGKIHDVESLAKTFDQLESQLSQYKDTTVLVEGAEFLLSATQITASQLLAAISKLQRQSSAMFIISSADSELWTISANNASLPEFKTNDFLQKCIHRSHLVISLRPLDTGKAKDVTGTLTIARGALPLESLTVQEKEYLFLVSKEGTKLFFR